MVTSCAQVRYGSLPPRLDGCSPFRTRSASHPDAPRKSHGTGAPRVHGLAHGFSAQARASLLSRHLRTRPRRPMEPPLQLSATDPDRQITLSRPHDDPSGQVRVPTDRRTSEVAPRRQKRTWNDLWLGPQRTNKRPTSTLPCLPRSSSVRRLHDHLVSSIAPRSTSSSATRQRPDPRLGLHLVATFGTIGCLLLMIPSSPVHARAVGVRQPGSRPPLIEQPHLRALNPCHPALDPHRYGAERPACSWSVFGTIRWTQPLDAAFDFEPVGRRKAGVQRRVTRRGTTATSMEPGSTPPTRRATSSTPAPTSAAGRGRPGRGRHAGLGGGAAGVDQASAVRSRRTNFRPTRCRRPRPP